MTNNQNASLADNANITAADPLSADAVADYLLQHPQFFHHHSALLMELSIPHESGKAISLLERQVALFRQRQEQLQDQFHDFLRNAHANDNLFEKTRHMILALLQCPNVFNLRELVEQRFPAEFNATAASLVLVNDTGLSDKLSCIPVSAVRIALGELYLKQSTYCGPLNKAQRELLFPQHPEPLLSAAIVPLKLDEATSARLGNGLPLLLIASADREHFNSSLDTLFLDFLGEILTIHLHNLLQA